MSPNQTQSEPYLRWLFVATFEDGSTVEQTQEDVSKDGTASAYKDVLDRKDELASFGLHHIDGSQYVVVDLKKGYFIVNGVPLVAHNQYFEADRYPLELVYFRETRAHQDVIATVQEDGSIGVGDPHNRINYVNRYFLGWKTTVNGKEKQTTLAAG